MVKKIKIYKNFKINMNHKSSVILIGNFDGLHSGHQKLFKQAQKFKKKLNLKLGVITFDPIPKMFFIKKLKIIESQILIKRLVILKNSE